MKKSTLRRAFFSEINPFGICEMHFVGEIWLCHVKCAGAREEFFAFDCPATVGEARSLPRSTNPRSETRLGEFELCPIKVPFNRTLNSAMLREAESLPYSWCVQINKLPFSCFMDEKSVCSFRHRTDYLVQKGVCL